MMIVCMLIISSYSLNLGKTNAVPGLEESQTPEGGCESETVPDISRKYAVDQSHRYDIYINQHKNYQSPIYHT